MASTTGSIDVSDDVSRELLREMVRIKIFEEGADKCSDAGEIPGFLHLCRGHEGSHAGMGVAMEEDDWLAVGGARLHGQYIVKGVPLSEIMAELFGNKSGTNRGKGGSMHVCDVDRHLYGHAATIGSGQNPAVGLALAQDMRDTGNVVVTTIGDGGTSRGSFHTALVFAAYWNLPVVFVIENNQYAISTPADTLPPEQLSDYGDAYGIPSQTIDGTDAEAVYDAVSEALERARTGNGPTLIESEVYRLVGHFGADRESYRDKEEKQRLREQHDPIDNFRDRMENDGKLLESEFDALVAEVKEEVDEAIEFAREGEHPDPQQAYEDVYDLPLYGQKESEP